MAMSLSRRWYKGDGPWTISVRVTENGRTKDLTGATEIFWWFYQDINAPVVTKTLGAGVELDQATEGVAVVTVDKADVASLLASVYTSRLRVIDADGTARTVNEEQTLVLDSPPEA
jgi:hypothetical protein